MDKKACATPDGSPYSLPTVSGRLERTLDALERGALVMLAHEQEKILPDNALIAVLCDTVRLCRESGSSYGHDFERHDE
jgi:hypothetical protein